MIVRFFIAIAFLVWVQIYSPIISHAWDDSEGNVRDPKASLDSSASGTLNNLNISPVKLDGGSTLTVISGREMAPIAERLSETLSTMHSYLTYIFGEIPAFETSIRLMDEETFHLTTGAPKWTNAMFYRSQIIIPLAATYSDEKDFDNLQRSIKHEYTHAVVNALSGGKCPGWLDEGLAQWSEGAENPALPPALEGWLRTHAPIHLNALQGGFTKLNSTMVPAAYAQSLFAANTIMEVSQFEEMRAYFDDLRRGRDKGEAFLRHFRMSEQTFEAQLGDALRHWARERKKRQID